MKNILIILITIISFSCKAQQPIIALDSLGFDIPNGAYLKDLSHDLDKFVGTWVMQSPFSKLTIKIKKIDQYNNDTFFEDISEPRQEPVPIFQIFLLLLPYLRIIPKKRFDTF